MSPWHVQIESIVDEKMNALHIYQLVPMGCHKKWKVARHENVSYFVLPLYRV